MTFSDIALNDEFKEACITKRGFLDMQVCVPGHWTDEGIVRFAERNNPCGTEHGWHIRKQGSKYLSGADERVQCSKYADRVHVMLDA